MYGESLPPFCGQIALPALGQVRLDPGDQLEDEIHYTPPVKAGQMQKEGNQKKTQAFAGKRSDFCAGSAFVRSVLLGL